MLRKPKPTGSAIAQTVCSGSSTNVALNSTVTGNIYWTAAIISTRLAAPLQVLAMVRQIQLPNFKQWW
jgi:hypothetical protein